MVEKRCPLCKQEIEERMLDIHVRKERVVIDLIKKKHPEWVEEDGACPRCIEYYRVIESN